MILSLKSSNILRFKQLTIRYMFVIFWLLLHLATHAQQVDSTKVMREIDSLLRSATRLADQQDIERSMELIDVAKKTAINYFGRLSLAYARCCFNLGRVMYFKGDYSEAEKWFLESKNNMESSIGRINIDYSKTLTALGVLFWRKGEYEKAELFFLESGEVQLRLSGKDNIDYAWNLNNLGALYRDMSKFENSESAYEEAKNIFEKKLGKRHIDYAASLNNLGGLYADRGQFEKAEPLFLEAITIKGLNLGTQDPSYALALSNIATLYLNLGQYKKSETLYIEVKNILEKTLGRENLDYAWNLNNLGSLYREMGQYDKAKSLFLEATLNIENLLGKGHPDYAWSLSNLGVLYSITREYEKAEQLLLEATSIVEKSIGKENILYANSLNDLAIIYQNLEKHEKSEELLNIAISIQERVLGKEQFNYVGSLTNLASLYKITGQINKLESILEEIFGINQSLMQKTLEHLSEQEAYHILNKFYEIQNQIFSFGQHPGGKKIASMCYENSLLYKGFLLNTKDQINRLALSDSNATEKLKRLKSYQYHLAVQYSLSISERDSAKVVEFETKANDLEKELVRTVAGYGELTRQVSWEEVKQQLRPGEATVELISYRYYTPGPTDSTMYAALVLLPTPEASGPHFIPLFEERQLQALFNRPGLDEEITVKGLYAPNSELLHLLWTPLEPLLRDVKTIYYSPAGLLHRINPAALRDADKQYLSEGRAWVRVGSTRELVTGRLADRSYALDPGASATAAVWGGIRYDMDSTAFAAANPLDPIVGRLPEYERKDGKFRYMVEDGAPALSTGLRGAGDTGWKPLAGSAREAEQVGELLQKAGFRTELLSGYAASEERFKALGQAEASPRILHVATHGFAYPDPKKEPLRGFGGDDPVYKIHDDPMLRSGLLLAGANHYWTAKRPLQNREDGVLVAYEVRDLNLRNTELAVLSACQTGLGDVVGSEGVYGLQRAFRIAGAKFLIVSLWQVPDEQTRELMRLFYENWVDKRESLRDAFNHAQATLREQEPNPYMWAGFVLIE